MSTPAAPTRVRYAVLAWLCVAAALAYCQRNSIGVAEMTVRQDLRLTPEQMGDALGFFFLSYSLFQIPSGWLCQVWGNRLALSLYAISWSLATACLGLVGSYRDLSLVRITQGAAQAGIFPAATSAFREWLPATRRAMGSGLLTSFMSVGGALGAWLTGELLERIAWRWLFILFAVPGLLWGLGFYVFYRNRPEEHGRVNAEELQLIRKGNAPEPKKPVPASWVELVASPTMLLICGQQFFRAAGYIFLASWFATWLIETHGVTKAEAGRFNSGPLSTMVVGSFVGGIFSDWILVKTGSRRLARKWLAIASMATCVMLLCFAYLTRNVWATVGLLSLSYFLTGIAAPCSYALTIDLGGPRVASVFGMMNMTGNFGAMALPMIVPRFVGWTGDWYSVPLLIAGLHAASALCWLPLDPERPIWKEPTATESAA